LARLLTPSDFGVVGAALIVVAFSAVVSRFGIRQAIVQRKDLEVRHTQAGFVIATGAALIMAVVLWVAAPLVARFYGIAQVEPVVRALTVLFPLRALATVAEARIRRELRFRWLAVVNTLSLAVGYGLVGIVGALSGLGVWALVMANISQGVLQTAFLLVAHPPRFRPVPDRASFKELMQIGGGFTVGSIASYVAGQGDNILVGRLLGAEALGLYGRAYQLMAMPANLFGGVLDIVLFPIMARVQDTKASLALAYQRGISAIALITAPAGAAMALVAPELIVVLLGSRWIETIAPLRVFALGLLFRTSYKVSESISRATGAVYRRAWRLWVYAALVLVGSWIGSHWGITGVAWAVLGALGVNYVLMAHLSIQLADVSWKDFWVAHAPAARLATLVAGITFVARELLLVADAVPVVVLAGAGSAALGGLLIAVWASPSAFLGANGIWIVEKLGLHPRTTASPESDQ
jgi:PST family polysaccharide transporter